MLNFFALVGIFFVAYFASVIVLTWKDIKASQVETENYNDIEMQKIIGDIKTKVIKFEPRRKK